MTVQSAQREISRRFIGKVALVTGAGQGIGRATALRLAREGAAVGILDRNPETTSETVSIIKEIGARALGLSRGRFGHGSSCRAGANPS